MGRKRPDGFVMISIVAERYNIHPQTLRLYEREGLLRPARTMGNTRLYGPDELRQLEMILRLTRDLGVNLAGVEVILNMVRNLRRDDLDLEDLLRMIRQQLLDKRAGVENRTTALVKRSSTEFQFVKRRA